METSTTERAIAFNPLSCVVIGLLFCVFLYFANDFLEVRKAPGETAKTEAVPLDTLSPQEKQRLFWSTFQP